MLQGPCRGRSPLLGNLVHIFDFLYEHTHSRWRHAHKHCMTFAKFPMRFKPFRDSNFKRTIQLSMPQDHRSLWMLTSSRSGPGPECSQLSVLHQLTGHQAIGSRGDLIVSNIIIVYCILLCIFSFIVSFLSGKHLMSCSCSTGGLWKRIYICRWKTR